MKGKMVLMSALASFVGLVCLGAVALFMHYDYDQEIGGHLKRAADANQPETASAELATALEGIERAGYCTEGMKAKYTSIIVKTPDEDLCFWRKNLEETLADLNAIPPDASRVDITNSLIKVRETLVDQGQAVSVTAPDGVSRYPYNGLLATLMWIFISGFLIGMVTLMRMVSKDV